jgi:hypothetical protein
MAQAKAPRTEKDVKKVSVEIRRIYRRREVIAFALASSLAIRAINLFRKNQSNNKYWINRTSQALNRAFSDAFKDSKSIGFFLAHGVKYGVYLELANDRKHEALRPIISGLAIKFVKDLKFLYGIG